jgi:hypothetical protein
VGKGGLAGFLRRLRTRFEVIGEIRRRLATGVAPSVYDDYVGEYQVPPESGGEGTIVVTREGDRLLAQASFDPSGRKYAMYPESETSFFHLAIDGVDSFEMAVVRDEAGRAAQLIVRINGQEIPCTRIE